MLRLKKFYFKSLPNFIILIGIIFLSLSIGPFVKDEAWYYLKEEDSVKSSAFARFLTSRPTKLEPVNKKFSIVIEKIGVSAPIVADVPVTDEKAYREALKNGVAHASSSSYPSTDPGNVYLFAHASLNFWSLGKYATVFNLLRKLNPHDRIHIFYENKDYVYEVVGKEVVRGWNTYPITKPVIEPILTLQTCDPPGTTLNRLVVTAKLVAVN